MSYGDTPALENILYCNPATDYIEGITALYDASMPDEDGDGEDWDEVGADPHDIKLAPPQKNVAQLQATIRRHLIGGRLVDEMDEHDAEQQSLFWAHYLLLDRSQSKNTTKSYQKLAEAAIRAAILTAQPGTPPTVVVKGKLDDPRIMQLVAGLKEALVMYHFECWFEKPPCSPSITVEGPLSDTLLQSAEQEACRRLLMDYDNDQANSPINSILATIRPIVSEQQLSQLQQTTDTPKRVETLKDILKLAVRRKDTDLWQCTQKPAEKPTLRRS